MNSPQAALLDLLLRLVLKLSLARRSADADSARRARRRIQRLAALALAPPGWQARDVDLGGVSTRMLRRRRTSPRHRILYFHGGGFYVGTARAQTGLLWRLARAADAMVLAPDYRLAPEHPHPAAQDDALAAWVALLGQGVDPRAVLFGGDSAGGNLALCTLLRARAAGLPLPAGAFAFSPWTDLAGSGGSVRYNARRDCMLPAFRMLDAARSYCPERPLDDPSVSPLYADLIGLPPLQLHVSSSEILLDDGLRLADAARRQGVAVELRVHPRLPHGFPVFADVLPEARAAIDEVGRFARMQYAAALRNGRCEPSAPQASHHVIDEHP